MVYNVFDYELHKYKLWFSNGVNIGFLGQLRKMSSQFNHQSILFRTKSNATEKRHSISFYD